MKQKNIKWGEGVGNGKGKRKGGGGEIENIQLINNKKYNENIYNNCNIVIMLNGWNKWE